MAKKSAHQEMKGPIGRVPEAKRAEKEVPAEPSAFKASASAGGHVASPLGIASAHIRSAKMTKNEESAELKERAREHAKEATREP